MGPAAPPETPPTLSASKNLLLRRVNADFVGRIYILAIEFCLNPLVSSHPTQGEFDTEYV